jgi:hypothetical protein
VALDVVIVLLVQLIAPWGCGGKRGRRGHVVQGSDFGCGGNALFSSGKPLAGELIVTWDVGVVGDRPEPAMCRVRVVLGD